MTMTLKGGNIKSGQAAKDVFERELKPGEVGRLMVKVLRANTPKVSGRLRLNWRAYERPVWHQNTMTIRIENEAPYSYRVNVRGKSRGYVERGVEAARTEVVNALRINLGQVVKELWDGDTKR